MVEVRRALAELYSRMSADASRRSAGQREAGPGAWPGGSVCEGGVGGREGGRAGGRGGRRNITCSWGRGAPVSSVGIGPNRTEPTGWKPADRIARRLSREALGPQHGYILRSEQSLFFGLMSVLSFVVPTYLTKVTKYMNIVDKKVQRNTPGLVRYLWGFALCKPAPSLGVILVSVGGHPGVNLN